LPNGKIAGWFEKNDVFKIRDAVGNTMRVVGYVPIHPGMAGDPGSASRWCVDPPPAEYQAP
jgi:hypothetical protein